jgi:hypothetical protein
MGAIDEWPAADQVRHAVGPSFERQHIRNSALMYFPALRYPGGSCGQHFSSFAGSAWDLHVGRKAGLFIERVWEYRGVSDLGGEDLSR